MGAYTFIKPRFETCLRALDRTFETPLPYAGRPPMAATATGVIVCGVCGCFGCVWLSWVCVVVLGVCAM